MPAPIWRFQASRPVAGVVYDGVRIVEVTLRFPADVPPGGAVSVQPTLAGVPVGSIATIPIPPAMLAAAAIAQLQAALIGPVLEHAGVLAPGDQPATVGDPVPVPVAAARATAPVLNLG